MTEPSWREIVAEAAAFVVDYAGSEGTVVLSAEAEINLKITALKFSGTLMAWAQLPVRVLVPAAAGFRLPHRIRREYEARTEWGVIRI